MEQTQIKVTKIHDYLKKTLSAKDYAIIIKLIDLEIELEAECNQ